jgi:integrase/recombinase XerD
MHVDTVDFYSARSRAFLIKGLSNLFNKEESLINQDVTALLKQAEQYRTKDPDKESNQEMTAKDKAEALKVLQNPGIVSDPGKDIRYAKIPKTLPKSVLTPKEAKRIIHAPDLRTTTGYRDRTFLEILYSSGIRKDEVNQLTIKGVDYNDGYLMIENGKGGKDRIVPIGKIACRYLENYIKSVRPELLINKGVDHLFLSLRGRQLSKNVVWDLVKKYAKKARIKKNVHPHTFRHTCATGMLKNKADLNTIRKILGHSSLNTTQIYTHLNISDLKAVHKKCHPREKDKV